MAATDMKLAGLEPGCIVTLPDPDVSPFAENHTAGYRGFIRRLRAVDTHWRLAWVRDDGHVELHQRDNDAIRRRVNRGTVTRDYDDAQEARRRRFDQLLEHFPGETGVPEENDTIERFVCVQKNHHPTGDSGHAFLWGDTFEEAVEMAGSEVLDDWYPQGVFDLDTGEKIDVHVSSPVITRYEDQGATINELDPEQVADAKAFEAEAMDHVADSITVSITCAPKARVKVVELLEATQRLNGVEHFQVKVEPVKQMNMNKLRERVASYEQEGRSR